MVDAFLGKKYKLSTSENFDDFMKALGVGLVTRKMGATVSPVISLNKDGDDYVLTSQSTFKNMTSKFKPGVEFDDETADGRKVKSTITFNGNILTEIQKDNNGKVTTLERTFTDSDVTIVCKVDDIVCTRVYKLQDVKFLWCLCVLESNLDVFYHSCALEIRLLTGRETRTKLQEVVRKGINTLNKHNVQFHEESCYRQRRQGATKKRQKR
ncbi:Lipocalin / cytosolic fatty-acid binding protein family [Popillia japonica]|uniref:Fatty acid-binding protein, muscle n=1 Tax=Popillia japonica TaxID=7064 RepID=A0AAW1HV64_POPJA